MDLSARGQRSAPHFTPGAIVADRYRLLSLLGRGGMGEVYRAEDMKLGEEIAIKFIPDGGDAQSEKLESLLKEARLSRRITHPNVCRVFDVGEVEGRPFITMEFVDGEDFASLLRRIRRLPPDKALHVAHQLCAGLAAAHEKGILHRDLKPANILLDESGEVRIADFGLAGLAEELGQKKLRIGTPAYMAPEQLRRQGASVRSDLYALGLILFEMFTGKPVYRPETLEELEKLHNLPPPIPSMVVPDIDPRVEQAILWCLEPDPERRPQSAAKLSSALPGGNTLSAALLAGKTPSPQQVAAAGERGAIGPRGALMCSGLLIAGILCSMWIAGKVSMLPMLPLEKPPQVLADKAADIIARLGYRVNSRYRAYAFDLETDYLQQIRWQDSSRERWQRLHLLRPAAVNFWYRQAEAPLVPSSASGQVDMDDPPPIEPGMIGLRLDPLGRLRELEVVGAARDAQAGAADFAPLFQAAGLELGAFRRVPPARVPRVFVDVRAAFEGSYPEDPAQKVRVEVGALAGRPVVFRIEELGLPGGPGRTPRPWQRIGSDVVNTLLDAGALIGAIILAWLNLKNRRGDRIGALRVALVMLALSAGGFLLKADHVYHFTDEMKLLGRGLSESLVQGLWFWLIYIAAEPYVRRLWPETLISWSRLLTGQWRDPLVGMNVVVGALLGCLGTVIFCMNRLGPGWLGSPPSVPWIRDPMGFQVLEGGTVAAGLLVSSLVNATRWSMGLLMILVLFKLLFRRKEMAALACSVAVWISLSLRGFESPLSFVLYAVMAVASMAVLIRFGLLALLIGRAFFDVLTGFPMFLELGRFYSALTIMGLIAVAIVLGFGLMTAAGVLAGDGVETSRP